MIVDDHAVVRSGLNAFLSSYDDMALAGFARSGEEAVQLCREIQPDVILMDLIMPGMDGVLTTKEILRQFPKIQVLVLTSFKDEALVKKAIKAGAIGYIMKDIQADEIAEAIRMAYAGKSILSPEATQALVHDASRQGPLGDDLGDRERQVLSLMVKGLSNTEIASHMVVSLSTVKYHVSHILTKLDAANRAEAVALAIKNHLVL
jgi:NarL family two-component system response regulator LiaR